MPLLSEIHSIRGYCFRISADSDSRRDFIGRRIEGLSNLDQTFVAFFYVYPFLQPRCILDSTYSLNVAYETPPRRLVRYVPAVEQSFSQTIDCTTIIPWREHSPRS